MNSLSTSRISLWSAEHRWLVIIGAVVAFVLSIAAIGMWLDDALTTDITQTSEPESEKAYTLLEERMGYDDPLTETVILTSDSYTVDSEEFEAATNEIVEGLRGLDGIVNPDSAATVNYYDAMASGDPAVEAQASQLVSEDRTTLLVPVELVGTVDDADKNAGTYLELIEGADFEGIDVYSVGNLSINETFNTIAEEDLIKGETIGLFVGLIILVVILRAVVAALIPIVLAILSIVVATGLRRCNRPGPTWTASQTNPIRNGERFWQC